jgi:hypothetical protein
LHLKNGFGCFLVLCAVVRVELIQPLFLHCNLVFQLDVVFFVLMRQRNKLIVPCSIDLKSRRELPQFYQCTSHNKAKGTQHTPSPAFCVSDRLWPREFANPVDGQRLWSGGRCAVLDYRFPPLRCFRLPPSAIEAVKSRGLTPRWVASRVSTATAMVAPPCGDERAQDVLPSKGFPMAAAALLVLCPRTGRELPLPAAFRCQS